MTKMIFLAELVNNTSLMLQFRCLKPT